MRNFQILVLRSTSALQRELSEIKKPSSLTFAGIVDSSSDACLMLEKITADAVLVELASPTADAYEFIEHVNFLPKKPLIAVVSALPEESYYARAKRMGGASFTGLPTIWRRCSTRSS
jgi:Response regulator receiver domain.